MITALLIGREGSRGVPGKNTMNILGKPLMQYPLDAALSSKYIEKVFVSTDSLAIKDIARNNCVEIIDRPSELASDNALVEDVIVHGFNEMEKRVGHIEIFVLLFCNTATIMNGIIDQGIEKLLDDGSIDSAVTVSKYNEYSPVRAKRIDAQGFIQPYIDIEIEGASCDRDTATPCYFCDCSAWILRRRCIDIQNGILPFRWMGKKSIPLYQDGGLDIDHFYGIAHTIAWLEKYGGHTV